MAGPESLLRASEGSAAQEFAYADLTGPEVRERHLGTVEPRVASHDRQERVAGFSAPVLARQRFAEWSLRYVLALAGVDALIGGVATAVPASMNSDPLRVSGGAAALPDRLAHVANGHRGQPWLFPCADRRRL